MGDISVEEDAAVTVLDHEPIHQARGDEGLNCAGDHGRAVVVALGGDRPSGTGLLGLADVAGQRAEPGHLQWNGYHTQFCAVACFAVGGEFFEEEVLLAQGALHDRGDPLFA